MDDRHRRHEAGRMMRDEPSVVSLIPGSRLEEGDQPCIASAGSPISINLDPLPRLPVSVSDGHQIWKRPCSHNGGFVVAQAIVCSPVEI